MKPESQSATQYLSPHQTRTAEPSEYENLLADALERSFAAGATELDDVVRALQDSAIFAPNGQTWTAELLASELKRLGE